MKVIGISGAKQAGKNTCANFLHGYQLRYYEVVSKFMMNESGDLLVNTTTLDENGQEKEGVGKLEIERMDQEFAAFASQSIWPFVRLFSFADALKFLAVEIFGLNPEQCYGTNEEKDKPTKLLWENMPGYTGSATGPMTGREFLQYFGTDVCRKMYDNIWIDSCLKRVASSNTELAIIADVRFPNEVKAIQEAGGKVIRLTRQAFSEDQHSSESALSDYEGFDAVIDNSESTIDETNRAILKQLLDWGWLQSKTSDFRIKND